MAFCAQQLPTRGSLPGRGNGRLCARRVTFQMTAEQSGKAGDSEETLETFRGKGQKRRALSGGDLLPYDVTLISPPPRALGRFRLDSRTHCGDVIEHGGTHFVVKRVTMHYQYGFDGRATVVRKSADVKTLARRAIEAYLERAIEAAGES